MKLYAFVATVLVVGSAVPAQAQDASKAAEDLGKKWVEAYDAGDAAAIAALFTPDGGVYSGIGRCPQRPQGHPERYRSTHQGWME